MSQKKISFEKIRHWNRKDWPFCLIFAVNILFIILYALLYYYGDFGIYQIYYFLCLLERSLRIFAYFEFYSLKIYSELILLEPIVYYFITFWTIFNTYFLNLSGLRKGDFNLGLLSKLSTLRSIFFKLS